MNFTSIPDELKSYPQFVVWRYEHRGDGKRAKVPYCPGTGVRASVADASTWATFETAIASLSGHEGIGFVLTENDPYAFIDLDDHEGDAATLERQHNLVKQFDSYTEVSPSKKGAHVIVKGAVPEGRRRGKIEVYSSGRYMTMTGNVYLPLPIRDTQELLRQLWSELGHPKVAELASEKDKPESEVDATLFMRAVNAANGAKFTALYKGEWLNEYASQSEADFALVNMLCFYSENNQQVRRMFRGSELGKREKAERDSYLNDMIRKIRSEKLPTPDLSQILKSFGRTPGPPFAIQTITGDELLSRTFSPVIWAIQDLIPQGVTLLVGAPKLGKSWLSLQIAIAISGAVPLWAGRLPEVEGDVLALCLEDNDRRLHDRLGRLIPNMVQTELFGNIQTPSTRRIHFATQWPRADQGGVAKLDEWLAGRPETRLLLIDTLARFRSQDDARLPPYQRDTNAIAELQALATRRGCAIVVIHHTRKDNNGDALDSISGTNGLSGAADASLILTRVRGQAEASLFLTGRDVEERTLALRFDHSLCLWTCIDTASDSSLTIDRKQVVEALRKLGPSNVKALSGEIGKPENAIRMLVGRMLQTETITKTARGVYALSNVISL